MDAVTPVSKLVAQAGKWGHEAIAVTDHAVAQSFPEAYSAGKKAGVKVIYGVEANLVNDGVPIAYNEAHRLLAEETYVVSTLRRQVYQLYTIQSLSWSP